VARSSSEIWEIKPRHLEELAAKEARYYTKFAKTACGPTWRPGTTYTTLRGNDVVLEIPGTTGIKAELVAEQGRPGAVLYRWRINGKEQPQFVLQYSWALRQEIVKKYFPGSGAAKPLPGAKSPDDLPPGKWKPPILIPGFILKELERHAGNLLKMITASCCPQLIEGGAVAVLVEPAVYDRIVGPSVVARQTSLMQAKPDPEGFLYWQTLQAFSERMAGAYDAAKKLLIVNVGVMIVVGIVLLAAELVGGALLVECTVTEAGASVAGASIVSTLRPAVSLMTSFAESLGRFAAVNSPGLLAAATGLVVFAIPKSSTASPTTPVSIRASLPVFKILTPLEAQQTRIGQAIRFNDADWVVVGLATPAPG
jgi:hypothetical protein